MTGTDDFYCALDDTCRPRVSVPTRNEWKVVVMNRIVLWIACAGVGFWMGSYRLIPLWGIIALTVLAVFLWCIGEWHERREGGDDDEG
jgi:hypothetical protein